MALARLVHTKRMSPTHIRELSVYYDKGGMNSFDYSQKPKDVDTDLDIIGSAHVSTGVGGTTIHHAHGCTDKPQLRAALHPCSSRQDTRHAEDRRL
jgi:hypothetical protein